MAYGLPLAPPPFVDDPNQVAAGGLAPMPGMADQPPAGLAPPPGVLPMPGWVQAPPVPTQAPPAAARVTPDGLAPPPPDVVSGAGMAPAPRAPDTYPAGPAGGHNAPSGYVDPEADLIRKRADLQSQAEDVASQDMVQASNDRRDREQAGRLMQVRDQQVADNAEADVTKAQDEARAMRVDPGHWWSSRSTGQKIASVIGAAIGGFLQVRQNRASNAFMDQINQSIHEDIAAQQANIANARESAGAKQSLYGMMLRKFGDRQTAYAATTAQMYEAARDQVAADVSKFKSPDTQLEGQQAWLQLEKARQAAHAQAVQLQGENALKLVKAQDEHAKSMAETRKLNAETGKLGREGRGTTDKTVPVMVHGPKGSTRVDLPADQAKMVQEAQKEQDAAEKEQSEHAGKHGAEYETWVTRQKERQRRTADTLRAAGIPEDVIASIGIGFEAGGVGGNEQAPQKMTPQEQNTYFQGGAPSERGLVDFNNGNPNVPAGPAPAGLPPYVAPAPNVASRGRR